MKNVIAEAKKRYKTIIFPEGEDKRIREAVRIIVRDKIVKPVLLNGNVAGAVCIKVKQDPVRVAMMMLKNGEVDACVTGAMHTSRNTFHNGLEIIGGKFISSSFYFPERQILMGDCAVNREPDVKQLANIAIQTAQTAKLLGIKPRIAMLSFSTKGSGNGPSVDIVRKATALVKKKGYIVDGELQADAALVRSVGEFKNPKGNIKGDANVLIFPNLDAGNIGYKLVERLAGLEAVGPIVQGFNKPVNDLSRGCSVKDIIYLTAITALQVK